MTTTRIQKAGQLSGPGVKGTEVDTSRCHGAVDREQLTGPVADAEKLFARVGLGL
jgi:hypothetical protein